LEPQCQGDLVPVRRLVDGDQEEWSGCLYQPKGIYPDFLTSFKTVAGGRLRVGPVPNLLDEGGLPLEGLRRATHRHEGKRHMCGPGRSLFGRLEAEVDQHGLVPAG
jgi:hypothetical protein